MHQQPQRERYPTQALRRYKAVSRYHVQVQSAFLTSPGQMEKPKQIQITIETKEC